MMIQMQFKGIERSMWTRSKTFACKFPWQNIEILLIIGNTKGIFAFSLERPMSDRSADAFLKGLRWLFCGEGNTFVVHGPILRKPTDSQAKKHMEFWARSCSYKSHHDVEIRTNCCNDSIKLALLFCKINNGRDSSQVCWSHRHGYQFTSKSSNDFRMIWHS